MHDFLVFWPPFASETTPEIRRCYINMKEFKQQIMDELKKLTDNVFKLMEEADAKMKEIDPNTASRRYLIESGKFGGFALAEIECIGTKHEIEKILNKIPD